MYLLLPILLCVASLALIFLIASRKFVYLKMLAPEVIEDSTVAEGSFWYTFFSELIDYLKSVQVREQIMKLLGEIEKGLRKLRLVSLKIESLMYNLIIKIRLQLKEHKDRRTQEAHEALIAKSQEEALKMQEMAIQQQNTKTRYKQVIIDENLVLENNDKYWKEEEQRLIMSIAKSPRDAELYKQLGNVYAQTHEWDDARQSFEKALELDPADYVTKTKLARVLHQIKNEVVTGRQH